MGAAWSWVCASEWAVSCNVQMQQKAALEAGSRVSISYVKQIQHRVRADPLCFSSIFPPQGAEYADEKPKKKMTGRRERQKKVRENIKTNENKQTNGMEEQFPYLHGWERFACQNLNALRKVCERGDRNRFLRFPRGGVFRMLKGWNSIEISLTKHTLSRLWTARWHVIRGFESCGGVLLKEISHSYEN